MTATTGTTAGAPAAAPAVDDILAAAEALAPTIAARAAEAEAARRLPADLLARLIDAGCFRILQPTSHGGSGGDLPSALRLFESIARADASTGWVVMIGAGSWIDLAGLPRSTFDALFAAGPPICAGAFNPSGSIEPIDGGYRVNGRWSFASGCEHADWLFGNCMEMTAEGPRLRMVVFAPGEVTIEDTWHVSGLRATGSHHFHVTDLTVAAERTFPTLAGQHCIDEPIAHIPPPSVLGLLIASVALGTAQGAVDDVLALAATKVPLLAGATLATNARFHHEVGEATTTLRAARALVRESAEELWAAAVGGEEFDLPRVARFRAAGAWATSAAAEVVGAAYRAGGGSALYDDCPLQRRLRDVHAITQHFLVKSETFTHVGAVLAGQEPQVMVF